MRSYKWILIISALLLFVSGCNLVEAGDVKSQEIIVEKDNAKELNVELNLGVGELRVGGGSEEWVTGSVNYNVKTFKADVTYSNLFDKGKVVIEQPNQNKTTKGNIKNSWDLNLSNDVPIKLEVNSGASETQLDLSGIQLKELTVHAGVGDVTVDLTDKWNDNIAVDMELGVGKATIVLPNDMGVKIKATKGIGDISYGDLISKGNGVYVNKAYHDSKHTLTIHVETGIGSVVLK